MRSYLQRFEATPAADRWPLVRGWLFGEPLPLFAELRRDCPILVMSELTLVTSFADCSQVLRQHDIFSVALYKPKQGDYWMAEDDTAVHWREKAIMRAILDRDEVPGLRGFVADKAGALLAQAGGAIDAVAGLSRAVPLALVQERFGFAHSDAALLCQWSYWNQLDAFWNQPFDAHAWPDPGHIVARRQASNLAMGAYLLGLVALREGQLKLGLGGDDPVSRLLLLSESKAVRFDLPRVVLNVGGLLIGAVETSSHAVINVLEFLLQRPDLLPAARSAALSDDAEAIDGFVFEALRFRPAFPYFFRTCERDTVLGRGGRSETAIAKGSTVLAVTHSAMFDPQALDHPDDFDPSRGQQNQFHFGFGLHECLGRAIGAAMVPEIVRQALRLENLTVGLVDRQGGPIPEAWQWSWH
jgi:cytochrome P450